MKLVIAYMLLLLLYYCYMLLFWHYFTIPHTPHYMSILSNRGISHTDMFVFLFFPSITDCVMHHVF